ncbi:MAG TPA: MXAN_6640 family putative metalloprotease [Nocardioides sp.]|uniref:MXAN_6640 family putative metalloprotease n=1 Tax=Nocardioides sp. TaxID=35761 RepID=UPI002E3168BC|nr:MXAN_6640 family putative metalloprotease [Nocardioides sp.]HEX5088816.1 MXAN_6640 family putative metalloprotease [Nocardioides sp.]
MPHRRMLRRAPVLLLAVVTSVVALVATTLGTPATAATNSSQAGVTHAKKADQHWSRAQRAKHALARATKALAPDTPASERPDATLALRNLFLLKDALSPADRAAADRLAQRPNKPAVVGDANILVHYDPAELNPAAYSVNQALSSLEYVADSYANAGYRRPKPDGTKGGDGRIDIYLDSLEPGLYGYCTTDQRKLSKPGHFDVWAYCVLDNDYAGFPAHTPLQNLQVTAAHEYYHATQFAYDIADDGWFLESTATWAEDELFPDVNDNVQYLRDSPITRPNRPMDKFGGVFHYGVWNFFRYLTEHYPAKTGPLPGLLLKMWQYADSSKGPKKDLYSTQAINKALKKADHTSLAEQFANYSAATRATHATFAEGAALNYPSKPLAGAVSLPSHKHKSFKAKLDHLTSSTFQFVPGGGTSKLKVKVKMASKQRGSRAVYVIYGPGGMVQTKAIKVNGHGVGHKKIVFDGSVTAVEVTLVNASTRYKDCYRRPNSPYSCQGAPVDDNLKAIVQAKAV